MKVLQDHTLKKWPTMKMETLIIAQETGLDTILPTVLPQGFKNYIGIKMAGEINGEIIGKL